VILTDREIRLSLKHGAIRIDPPPAEDKFFSSTSVDLTLDQIINVPRPVPTGLEQTIDPSSDGFDLDAILDQVTERVTVPLEGYTLARGKLILAWTKEYVELKKDSRIAARVEGKSSLARLGLAIHLTAPIIHSGFKGTIRLEVVNHGQSPIRLKPGMRICQLVFETTLGTPDSGYQGQFLGQTPR
jgi:dCTP deaminase